jgi:hypothetical protein
VGKVLFGLLIAALVWVLFFTKRKITLKTEKKERSPKVTIEQIVTCTRCGVNIPQSEAKLGDDGTYVCSNAADCNTAPR